MPRKPPFVFIMPVSNPERAWVRDYSSVEAALKATVGSLLNQTYADIRVVVVCHRTPSKSAGIHDPRVTYLDVSACDVFRPGPEIYHVDKGYKHILGTAFAMRKFNPELVMIMDADDFVNVRLADLAVRACARSQDVDGFVVDYGVHVEVEAGRGVEPKFGKAILVNKFNRQCGTCRIFRTDRLVRKMKEISPAILDRLSSFERAGKNTFRVPPRSARWLRDAAPESDARRHQLLYLIGDHIRQEPQFNLLPLAALGAAKSCGHGNHVGPRAGDLQENSSIGELSMHGFRQMFGLERPAPSTVKELFNDWLPSRIRSFGQFRKIPGRYKFVVKGEGSWVVTPAARVPVKARDGEAEITICMRSGKVLVDVVSGKLSIEEALRSGKLWADKFDKFRPENKLIPEYTLSFLL